MLNRQVIFLTLITILETYCFNQAIFEKQYFFAAFFGYLLLRRLYTSFVITRIIKAANKAADKLTKK
ncbi:DUF3272 family protein [Streptococcus loxodontisalivarius]|uniref:DUF3272 family protein n=1 Tax=Streptococcus loxodontisalivarius TaxID=1349415 RepID=A0ABS2PTU9_9STRE|nr:DUF3272 family protein [Streptococcus loxodontisalivarius]MBM7643483.1 hypothetical protein [Streptococcus loxodontisalivarius]